MLFFRVYWPIVIQAKNLRNNVDVTTICQQSLHHLTVIQFPHALVKDYTLMLVSSLSFTTAFKHEPPQLCHFQLKLHTNIMSHELRGN
ncbi:hypothetical protein B9Z55_022798 [Caenorhabditis nigoni]|nr:hypothetical protein B9Z55_022798 [Caenorhabditis nigoni]